MVANGEPAVFVISLETSNDRRSEFTRRAAGTSVPWRFFDAHRELADPLNYDPRDAIIHSGYELSKGELACYSSHYAVWRKVVEEKIPQAVILEDDAIVDWEFLRVLLSKDLSVDGIDYLKLCNTRPVSFKILQEPFLGRCLIRFSGFAFGAVAYFLTAKGAGVLVDRLQTVRRAVDTEMDRDWAHGLPNLALHPAPAFEATGLSTLEASRKVRAPIPSDLRIARFKERVREKITRFIYA
ncbi:glycosyltransferase family 25 protein [Roseibium polysiphoniae]|nr:glycosyltransferase family 25 protein [Roseibium polysiphoniae]